MNPVSKPALLGWVLLILLLLAGSSYFRFADWDSHVLNTDEVYNIVAAIKLNSPHISYDAREYNYEHPFLGKKIMGMAIDSNQSYYNTSIIPADLYVYNYLGSVEYEDQIPSMRFMAALFGLLALIPAFLIGRTLFSTRAGLLMAALVGLSIGFINQSRILYQDAFLPFFFFMTIWCFLEWIKSHPHEKWNGVSISWGWLILTLLFLTMSGLVRLGQPSILAVGILVAVFVLKKRIIPWIIGIAASAVAVFWLYYPEALHSYWVTRQADAFVPGLYPQFILSYLSLQSLTFLGAVLVLLWYVFTRATSNPRSFLKSHWENAPVHHRASLILFVFFTLITLFFIPEQPRFYLLFSIIPLAFLSHLVMKSSLRIQQMVIVLLILDVVILFFTMPPFIGHTVAPLGPQYISDDTIAFRGFISELHANGIESYFTNDARLLIEDPLAMELPPYHFAYTHRKICLKKFGELFEGKHIVYNAAFPIEGGGYVCPFVTSSILHRLEFAKPGYEIYQIHPE